MAERLRTRIEEVTSRQLEVARLLAEGRTNPEIAVALGITLDGAKYHVSELLGRLGLDRREDVAEWYRAERRGQRLRRLSALFATAPRAFLAAAATTAVVAVGVLLAAALEGGRADDPALAAPATPTATVVLEPGAAPPVGAIGDASDLPPGLQSFPATLARRLRSTTLPAVVSWERVDWFDGCFDIPPDGGCPLSVSPVPGYRVVLDHQREEYVAHTALDAGRYALEAAPPIAPFEVAYHWIGTASDAGFLCLDLQLAEDGTGSIAGCGEAPTPILLAESGVGSRGVLDHVMSEIGAVESQALQAAGFSGTMRIEGNGQDLGAYLLRGANTWGHYLAIDAYTGSSSVATGLAIGWRDDNAEGCTDVQVMQYGVAYLSGCPDGSDGTVYLDDAQLERLFGWLDAYTSFQTESAPASSSGTPGDATYLTFAGAGSTPASDAVQQEITDWLRSLR